MPPTQVLGARGGSNVCVYRRLKGGEIGKKKPRWGVEKIPGLV